MGKRQKIVIISLVSLVVLVVIGIVIAQNIATTKIEKFLSESLPEQIKLDYTELDVSVLSGSLQLTNPKLTIYGKTTDSIILVNDMSSIQISNIGYWDYLVNNKISIESIQINEPKINYNHNKHVDSKQYKSSKSKRIEQDVYVDDFIITKGSVSMFNVENDSLMMELKSFDFDLRDIHFDKETAKQKIPITFTDYDFNFNGLFYQINEYDNLEIAQSKLSMGKSEFDELKLYTKYTKQELSRIISVERDHVDLKIRKITINNQEYGVYKDSIVYFKSPKIEIDTPIFKIYRDKLVADDMTIKALYSKMLRDLKLDLSLSEVLLKNAAINYSEKVKVESTAGEILFSNVNATIKNLGNTYSSSDKTTIDLDAIFMKTTPIKVNWYFDVQNVNDQFVFKADMGRLPAKDLNPFTEPNLKVKIEGELLKTYFTVDGNVQDSNVDLRTNYENLKVSVLDKEGKSKNRFLSVVANLFIKKDSNDASDEFREGMKKNIERDKTKSVFNYMWLNASAGLLSALTGDGKK